jgi:hypothetical protein
LVIKLSPKEALRGSLCIRDWLKWS